MPNPYFKFKEFTITHDKCAMKVGTDGVLIGAWANAKKPQTILDIGSGSGLIALMMAQRFRQAQITGIEIEEESFKQSLENIANSPFSAQVDIQHTDLQTFKPSTAYDLIVSNPPFFEGVYSSGDANRDQARHNTGLSQRELWNGIETASHEETVCCIILPLDEGASFSAKAKEYDWHEVERIWVKGQANTKHKRLLLKFGKKKVDRLESELILEESRNIYTPEFTALVKDFYLKL